MVLFKRKDKSVTAEDAYLKSEDVLNNIASAIGSVPAESQEQYAQMQPQQHQQPQVAQPQPVYSQPVQPYQPMQPVQPQVAPQTVPQPVPGPQVNVTMHLNKIYEMIATLDKGLSVLNDRQTAMEARLFRETN